MLKRFHGWIFIIGALLLLVAALMLAVRVVRTPGVVHAAQTLRLEQAVTQLEGGCLACHSTLIASPATLIAVSLDSHISPFDLSAAPQLEMSWPTGEPAAVEASLLDLGQRLLAVPVVDVGAHGAAVDAYLQVYQAAGELGSSASVAQTGTLLARLAVIERALRDLEHQASPVRISSGHSQSAPAPVAAAPGASSQAPIFLLTLAVVIGALLPPQVWTRLSEVQDVVRSFGVLFAAHRRGPPLCGVVFDSVWSGRLPVM